MEKMTPQRRRTVNAILAVLFLALLTAAMAWLTWMLADAADAVNQAAATPQEEARGEGLARLALLTFIFMALAVLLLAWAVIRMIGRLLEPKHHEPTEYVDAWSLAGRRVTPDGGTDASGQIIDQRRTNIRELGTHPSERESDEGEGDDESDNGQGDQRSPDTPDDDHPPR
jgi:hypothetical protein